MGTNKIGVRAKWPGEKQTFQYHLNQTWAERFFAKSRAWILMREGLKKS
jgi:hypothetical protein